MTTATMFEHKEEFEGNPCPTCKSGKGLEWSDDEQNYSCPECWAIFTEDELWENVDKGWG